MCYNLVLICHGMLKLAETWSRLSRLITNVSFTKRKPHIEWCYNLLICTIYVFMNACVKIDTISNLCACSFGQQLTK
jgi:hypothetical protein